jgi:hypothetical protein
VSLALLIMGVTVKMTFPIYQSWVLKKKYSETKARHKIILKSIGGFLRKNKYIPCPSLNSNGQSEEVCFLKNHQGALPYNTLGLPGIYSKDGFGRKITYIVDPALTNKNTKNIIKRVNFNGEKKDEAVDVFFSSDAEEKSFDEIDVRQISLNNKNGTKSKEIAIILISHGRSGGGAYKSGFSERFKSSNEFKSKNADSSAIYYEPNGQKDFDDIITWTTRDNLISIYAQIDLD